jgi:hypothetical protein
MLSELFSYDIPRWAVLTAVALGTTLQLLLIFLQ